MAVESEAALATSAIDPLLTHVELPYKALYFPYGFPAQIETNSRLVIQAAHLNWSDTRRHFPESPVLLRVLVSDGELRECPPTPTYRAQRCMLTLVADRENFGCCDLAHGFGAAWLNQTVTEQTEYVRYCFLEGMATSLIEMLYLYSMHAACVVLDGCGVLLGGESGAGKSSLSYACAKRGWTYVSDDCSSIVRKSEGRRVIGTPHSIRFRQNVNQLFPEIGPRESKIRGNGKPTIEVRTSDLAGIKTAFETGIDHIVFLDRRPEYGIRAQLAPFPREEARRLLCPDSWPLELPARREQMDVVERLLTANTYELRYRDLDPAIDRLEDLVRVGR